MRRGAPQFGQGFAGRHRVNVGNIRHRKIRYRRYIQQVVILLVCSADQILAGLQAAVQNNLKPIARMQRQSFGTNKTVGTKEKVHFLAAGRPHSQQPKMRDRSQQLCLLNFVVSSHQGHNDEGLLLRNLDGSRHFIGNFTQIDHNFDQVAGRNLQEAGDFRNRALPGSQDRFCRCLVPSQFSLKPRNVRSRLLHVRRVIAFLAANDLILARRSVHHEFLRLRSAHRARVRIDHHILQAAAVEDAAVGVVMLGVGSVESGSIDVERVRILHDELPHPQQPRLGTRLVAKLSLNLIPDLRQLLVAAQLLARDIGHDFFVGKAQAKIGALAVLEAKMFSPITAQRPLASQTSRGFSAGK